MTGDGLFLGLISGTSADGIDAALVAIGPPLRLLAARTHPYPAALRETLLALTTRPEASIALSRIGELDAELGECFATAALELLAAAGIPPQRVRAIGSHGQTVSHRPR
ncbi:MAG: anhydro-N-acetylmuramic acid kinase, partial [Elioraea sp.]|nr:anhydro-N-acetylmuramic acid kinase [Elioraea sp.]